MKSRHIVCLFSIVLGIIGLLFGCEGFLPVSRTYRISLFEDDLNDLEAERGDTYRNFHPDIRQPLAVTGFWDTNFPADKQLYNITITSQTDNLDGSWTVDCSYTDADGSSGYADPNLRFLMQESLGSWFIYSLTIEPTGIGSTIP